MRKVSKSGTNIKTTISTNKITIWHILKPRSANDVLVTRQKFTPMFWAKKEFTNTWRSVPSLRIMRPSCLPHFNIPCSSYRCSSLVAEEITEHLCTCFNISCWLSENVNEGRKSCIFFILTNEMIRCEAPLNDNCFFHARCNTCPFVYLRACNPYSITGPSSIQSQVAAVYRSSRCRCNHMSTKINAHRCFTNWDRCTVITAPTPAGKWHS